MTEPVRRYLLNRQIALEARRIAHAATKTCSFEDGGDKDDEHTKNCNALKREIQSLVMQVKLAAQQHSPKRDDPPALFEEPQQEEPQAS